MKAEEILDERHSIREKHYEETKHLSAKELAEKINQEGKEAAKKLGIRTKSSQTTPSK